MNHCSCWRVTLSSSFGSLRPERMRTQMLSGGGVIVTEASSDTESDADTVFAGVGVTAVPGSPITAGGETFVGAMAAIDVGTGASGDFCAIAAGAREPVVSADDATGSVCSGTAAHPPTMAGIGRARKKVRSTFLLIVECMFLNTRQKH